MVPSVLRLAKISGGILTRIGDGKNKFQLVYAGNCANILVSVLKHLEQNPEDFGGEMFFSTDGNGESLMNFYSFITPFMDNVGFQVSKQVRKSCNGVGKGLYEFSKTRNGFFTRELNHVICYFCLKGPTERKSGQLTPWRKPVNLFLSKHSALNLQRGA